MWAGTVVEPAGPDFGRDGVGDLEIEVGRLQAEFRAIGANEHVGKDGNGVASFDGAMHVPERPQQFRTLNGDLHRNIPFEAGSKRGAAQGFRQGHSPAGAAFSLCFAQH